MDLKEKLIVKGTAATLTLGLGYIPSRVLIENLTDRTALEWGPDNLHVAANRYGVSIAAAGTRGAVGAAVNGIVPYAGGDKMTAASTQYVVRNMADQKAVDVAAGLAVSSFTIDTAANYTGHFNCDVTGATIGPGSRITFSGDGKVYRITALTAGQGIASDEVTLDANPCANGGTVKYVSKIWPMFDYRGAAAGKVIPAGIEVGASATVNDTDGDVLRVSCWVE